MALRIAVLVSGFGVSVLTLTNSIGRLVLSSRISPGIPASPRMHHTIVRTTGAFYLPHPIAARRARPRAVRRVSVLACSRARWARREPRLATRPSRPPRRLSRGAWDERDSRGVCASEPLVLRMKRLLGFASAEQRVQVLEFVRLRVPLALRGPRRTSRSTYEAVTSGKGRQLSRTGLARVFPHSYSAGRVMCFRTRSKRALHAGPRYERDGPSAIRREAGCTSSTRRLRASCSPSVQKRWSAEPCFRLDAPACLSDG